MEGHGEIEAVPALVRRMAYEIAPQEIVQVESIRVPRHKLIARTTSPSGQYRVNEREIGRVLSLARSKLAHEGLVLVLVDADDDCPAELSRCLDPFLLQDGLKTIFVAAKKEFEAWFLAAAVSLRGKRGLSDSLTRPPDPEGIRGAKEWLEQNMASGRRYSPTLDQPALAALMDMGEARSSHSFARFYKKFRDWLVKI